MAKQIDTTVEIERAYIKDQITYQKVRNKKTAYFYDIAAQTSTNGKLMVALVYPFNYNATPYAGKKPEFNISWGDGTETTIRNKFVDMFDSHFSKVKPFTVASTINDIKLFNVPEKVHGVGEKLYHEYELNSDGTFKVNGKYILRMSIESEEIVVPFVLNANEINNLYYRFISGSNITAPLPLDENVFINYNNYTNSKAYVEQLANCISLVICSVGGEYPPNLIGLATDNYKDEFSKVFKRGIYHPLDQKIAHIKNGIDGIDDDIMSSINTNDTRYVVDYKSPSSMTMYALAGNNRFINKELLESIGTPNQHPIPIQACLCSGVFEIKDNYYYQRNKNSRGLNINPLLTPALINKGININNSILRLSIVTSTSDSSKVHLVFNPYQSIIKVFPDTNGEFKLFSNTETEEMWGFFCNFYRDWRYQRPDGTMLTSPWLYDTNGIYDLFKSLPATVKSMKCVYRIHQSYVDDKLYGVRNEHRILDAIPKSVQEIENLIVFSNLEFYKKGFRVYRDKQEYNELEAYNGGFRMLPFDNDDGVSTKYKNSNLKVIKNMVFCCDLYPEPLRLSDNTWTTNFDGVSLLYGFNSLEKVDGVFTYCRFKDTGYMRIRDICQRPQRDKYENPDEIEFKQIELSRVMHWCDVINELAEDGDSNEHALNPFNGHMVKKQRSSWNITPNYKMRDFFNKMNNETSFNPDKMPTFIFGKQENDADLKHMCLGFLFLERKSYPNDRLGGIIDQTPIFKSVTDFAHGYMMSYSYINCEVPDMTTKTVKIDGYIQQFLNHMFMQEINFDYDFDFTHDRREVYLRGYITGFINPQWMSPIGWMLVGKSIFDNRDLDGDLKNAVLDRFKSAIIDMSNMEGLFANIGALACDLTPMNEIYDKDLFMDKIIKVMINGVKRNIHIYSNRFGLYSYNEDDILIKSDKDVNIKRIFQNETYYGSLATDNFFQPKSKYRKWFNDATVYDDNELNKIWGFEHALAYNMTTFKSYEDLSGSDYKDRLISMGCPRVSPYDIPVWTDPKTREFEYLRLNSALGGNDRFKSSTTWAHDDNLLNWIFPPLITGYKYRYPTLYEFINAQYSGESRYAKRYTMNTQYPRGQQGANFLLTKGKFIVNTNDSSTNADYAFDGMILHFGLNKSLVHADVRFNSIKGITTKNTIGVIKHNCDWNFKDENVIGYIPTISRPFNTVVVGEPFTNLKHVIPKRIVPNIEELNEVVAIRINEYNGIEKYPNCTNAMVVPKVASTPARYRKMDNIQYKFKHDVEFEEFNYMPHNVVEHTVRLSHAGYNQVSDIFGVSRCRKLFPDDVNVHIKNFKMPYIENMNKFKYLYDRTTKFGEFPMIRDKFIWYNVPLDYALNGAVVDNIEEVKQKWIYKGTTTIFKSSTLIDGPLGGGVKGILRCPYNVDLRNIDFNVKVFIMYEDDWTNKYKINEKEVMLDPNGSSLPENNPSNTWRRVVRELQKVMNVNPGESWSSTRNVYSFQPPIWYQVMYRDLGKKYTQDWAETIDHQGWAVNDNPGYNIAVTSDSYLYDMVDMTNSIDENSGGSARYVSQLPKEVTGDTNSSVTKYQDRIEFGFGRRGVEFSVLVVSDIPLWLEGCDYIGGEFPPYSDYSEKYPVFKNTPIDENWFKTQCFDKQKIGFEIDDVFLELDEHFKKTSALLQIDNNDLGRPHRVNPYILEPTTRKGQTKFGEVISAYGRKFPIVNFRWTLGFAFSNLPKTVTEVDGFNFADTVHVPDKCVPEQITKFHFHKELLEPNQTYKQGIMDAVLWFNKPFMNDSIETPGSVDYFSNIMLFTRRKDSLSNGARTQMEEYYEWSTDNKIAYGPNNYIESYDYWKDAIPMYGNVSAEGRHMYLLAGTPDHNMYEMWRNYRYWTVADRNVRPDDIISVKWVIRFQNIIGIPVPNSVTPRDYRHTAIMNPHIGNGGGHLDMSEDVVTFTGKAKDLKNFEVFAYANIPSAVNMYRQFGLPTIKSIRIYGDVYVCPRNNWERGMWGVLRGTLPSGTDTRCVAIPQRCYEGIFYRDVKLHGIITGEYDGSLPEKLFWGTRNENLRIQGLYCSTRYANPNSWRTFKRCIRRPLINSTAQGNRYQINNLSRVKESGKIVTDNLPATLNNLYYPDSYHNVYNRLIGNNLYLPNLTEDKKVFPIIGTYDREYNPNFDFEMSPITDTMIQADNNAYAPYSMFYGAAFADRFNYIPTWYPADTQTIQESEIAYSYNFCYGAFSNVHDVSPLSIPHKIDELDVSYLGGFADLFEVYTDDVFGFTEPNSYNLNFPNALHPHQEKGYEEFPKPTATNGGGIWRVYPRPNTPTVPVTAFFGKWFLLNGTIRVEDNSDAYVFSDHRTGYVKDREGYSPHRFTQVEFDQSIYAVQSENVKRSSIYKIKAIQYTPKTRTNTFYIELDPSKNYYNLFINKSRSSLFKYYDTSAVTHGGFNSIERYSRSSIYFPSTLISETVGNIVETGYTPILSSLSKITIQKSYRNVINTTEVYEVSPIPMDCVTPQGYMSNWAIADEETMKCRTLVLKRLSDFNDKTIIQPPKWHSEYVTKITGDNFRDRFKYQTDIQNNYALMTSVIMCEPSKIMISRMNGKRRIKARYGRIRNIDYAGNFWIVGSDNKQPYHIIYERAIPGIVQPMIFKNSAYAHRLQCIRNLAHWHCNGFNYGLIDDTGMTQYIDVGREIFIEGYAGYSKNQMFIGCHPHLKEVKVINAAASEINATYRAYYDEETSDPETNVTVEINEASQHPSYNQTSRNCFINETLPYQPCLTKIRNMSTSPLYLNIGETALTHVLNYGSRVMHGAKFGRNADDWTWIIGEEQKIMQSSTNMRTALFPTHKVSHFVPTSDFKQDPVTQFSAFVDVIVDSKWVNRTMYARQDLPKDQQTPYQGIKIQGTFMGVWTNPETNAWGGAVAPRPKTAKVFDYPIMGNAGGGHVNYGPGKGKKFNYGVDGIINLHSRGILNRGLVPVDMRWWLKGKEEISLPNDYYLGSNMGLAGEARYRLSGNPNHNPELKVFLSHTFATYWFATTNTVSLHRLCDKSILSSGSADKQPEGIIVTDDYRFADLIGQPNTIIYGNQTPVVYCKSQRGWLQNSENMLKLDWWEGSTAIKPNDYTKPLLWIYEADSDITDFYSWNGARYTRQDFAKMTHYTAYNSSTANALNAFENSILRFNFASYPSTARLNVTNAFQNIRLRWFNEHLKIDAYVNGVLAKYKPNVANYVKDNFDRIYFNGKINIIGKSNIYSTI